MTSRRGEWKRGAKTKWNLLTEEEARKLASSCRTFLEELVVKGLLYTGMRVNEFIHMRRGWVNWDDGYIRVPESQPCNCYVCRKPRYRLDRKTGERKLVKPAGVWKVKVPEAARVIPLTPEVRPVLERYFGRFDSIMENVGSQPVAWRIVRGVAERAGLSKRIFPHALRGTFASILAGKGFDSFAIQAALGWKSIKTADEYVRISPDRLLRKFKEKW